MIISSMPHTDSWIPAPPVMWQHCDSTGQNFLSRQKITIRHFPINSVFVTRFQFCPGFQIYDERQKRTALEIINSILPVLVQATGEEENSGVTMTRWSVEFLNSRVSARFSKALAAAKVPISSYNNRKNRALYWYKLACPQQRKRSSAAKGSWRPILTYCRSPPFLLHLFSQGLLHFHCVHHSSGTVLEFPNL